MVVATKCCMFKLCMLIMVGVTLIGLFISCRGRESSKHHADRIKKTTALEGPEEVISLYKNNCMQCHGNEMQGLMGPKSNLHKIGNRLTKEEIAHKIQHGGKLMPAQSDRLHKMEIDEIATWLANSK